MYENIVTGYFEILTGAAEHTEQFDSHTRAVVGENKTL